MLDVGIALVRSRIVGWTLYALLALGIGSVFVHTALFKESTVEYFNRDWEVAKKDGRTSLRYKSATRQPTITIEFNRIDYLNRRLEGVLKIPRHERLRIRLAHVLSWEWPAHLRDEIGPTPDTYFIFPSEEEIYQLRGEDAEFLERKFQFRVEGNPALYPFDTYRAEVGVVLLAVGETDAKAAPPGQRPHASPVRVTTKVEEFLPDFSMTARQHALTFQKEAQASGLPVDNSFSFALVRPRFLRFFTVYIYAIALGVLIYLGFSRTAKELLGGALGYFAALWGIRSIIAGKAEVFPTAVDYVTLCLYSALVLVVIGRLLHGYYAEPARPAARTEAP
jgi:hypothetical protein